MRSRTILASVILLLACGLMQPAWGLAEVVGHITQVEGRVDLLRGGKLPATPVALQDKVESGDVLRTKTMSKAQITFIDNSVITLSPESRMAVDEYRFEPGQQKRQAVLNIFYGMAHVLVNKLFKVDEPDYVIKTHTAVTGVRGTDFGVRLQPNATTILNFEGITQVANIFPEVGKIDLRAFKAAYAFGSANSPNSVLLQPMHGTTVGQGMPPTLPFSITSQDQKQFHNQMGFGVLGRQKGQGSGGSGAGTGTAATGGSTTGGIAGGGTEFMTNLGGPDSGLGTPVASSGTTTPSVPLVAPTGLTTGTGDTAVTMLNTVTVPPEVTPPAPTPVDQPVTPPSPPPPSPGTYTFQQTGVGTWVSTASSTTASTLTSSGWGTRTWTGNVLSQSYYKSSGAGARDYSQGAPFVVGTSTGTSTGTLTGSVYGVLGSTLTGTATYNGVSAFGNTTNYSGTVVIDPSGQMTFTYANGAVSSATRLTIASGTTTYAPGTYFKQDVYGLTSDTANGSTSPPYGVQSTTTTVAGSTTTSGPLAQYYALVLAGSQASGWPYNYRDQSYNSLWGTLAGVLNPTTGQGAATITGTDDGYDQPFVSVLPTPPSPYLFGRGANDIVPIVTSVSQNPTTGVLSGSAYGTDYQDGRYASAVFSMTQTPQASPITPITGGYNFTETYTGNFWFNGSSSGAPPGSTNGSGYGYRSGSGTLASYLNGYFGSYANGGYTVASGSMPAYGYGSALFPGSGTSPATTLLSGSVSGTLGQNLTGTMTWLGSLLNGPSFNYQGTVTISSDGYLRFTYGGTSGSATWVYPGGPSGTASGELNQFPGYYFTQTVPGTYQLTTTSPNQGTLTLTGSSASRTMVYGGSLGPFSGSFRVDSPSGSLSPVSGSIDSALSQIEGVVGTSWLGANSGPASLTLTAASPGVFSVTIPGQISLVPGGSYFQANGGLTPSNGGAIQVSSSSGPGTIPTALAQLPLYGFSETYQGFRIGNGSAPFTLANVEGYGWGTLTGSSVFGTTPTTPLPTSYTGGASTGYFVSQDLGTRASLSAITPGWASVKGTMTGILSGTAGQTMTGQMVFTGVNSLGTTYQYQGNATLASNGTLVWNYYGNWTNGANTGTANGEWTQVLGTSFTETVSSGTFVQAAASTTIGGTTYASKTVQDAAPLSGNSTLKTGTSPNTTVSYAGIQTSTVNTFTPAGGTPNLTIRGVVAGSPWQTRWGVASLSGTGIPTPSSATGFFPGTVTVDPTTNKLVGQFVDTVPNGPGLPLDNVTVNLVSVQAGAGQTTASMVATTPPGSGNITQTPTGATPSTQATLITPTPLPGTSAGLMSGNINTNVNLTTTAVSPTYVTAGTGPMSAQVIAAVGGPTGGTMTGVASMHSLKTIGGTTRAVHHHGTATLQPAAGSAPATLTTNLNGINPSRTGVAARQAGTVTVTPRP